MADTDAAAVLDFASPLRWAEGIFTRWLADSGYPISGILASGVGFLVVNAEVRHQAAIHMDEILECALHVEAMGRRSVDLYYSFTEPGGPGPAVEVRIRHVYSALMPSREVDALPNWFMNLCSAGQGVGEVASG